MDVRPDEEPPIEDLLERHLPSLRAYVRRNLDAGLADRESTSDLVQSVCREVLQSRGRFEFRGDAAFQRWLLQVALHKLMDRRRFWRARKREGLKVEGQPGSLSWSQDELGRLAVALGSPSAEVMLREDLQRLEGALEQLSEFDREVIRLVRLQGLSHAEFAARMGCTEPQSRKRLFEALARLSLLLRRGQTGS
jgi:RNA polymerase sigma factor (sigma-70 family)